MTTKWDWEHLMTEWNQAILNSSLAKLISPDLQKKGWLGNPGATETQVEQLEHRLGVGLPPSYRDFLLFTNGWEGRLNQFIYRLWSVENIAWYSERNQDLIAAWIEGVTSSNPKAPLSQEDEHLKTTLEISDYGNSANLLLNPKVISENDEWEAWFFADWVPGADRYPSFWELMKDQYQSFIWLEKQKDSKLFIPPSNGTIL